MSIAHLLTDFSSRLHDPDLGQSDSVETFRLDAFEEGYGAGWDDGAAAVRETQTALRQDVLENLANLSLTQRQAYNTMLSALTPLIQKIGDELIPKIARECFTARLVEIIVAAIKRENLSHLTLSVNPDQIGPIRDILTEDLCDTVTLRSSADVPLDHAFVSTEHHDVEFTYHDVIAQISDDLAAFLSQNHKG